MTLAEIIAEARNIIDDETGTVTTELWSDSELVLYINEALDKLVTKVRHLIPDGTTTHTRGTQRTNGYALVSGSMYEISTQNTLDFTDYGASANTAGTLFIATGGTLGSGDAVYDAVGLCQLLLVSGTSVYDLHPKVQEIIEAQIDGETYPLSIMPFINFIKLYPNWRDTTADVPSRLIKNYQNKKILVHPTPDDDYTLYLSVYRRNINYLSTTDLTEEPEIAEEYHMDLIPYVVAKCYMKQDTEVADKIKAAEWLGIATKTWDTIHQKELRKIDFGPNGTHYGAR